MIGGKARERRNRRELDELKERSLVEVARGDEEAAGKTLDRVQELIHQVELNATDSAYVNALRSAWLTRRLRELTEAVRELAAERAQGS